MGGAIDGAAITGFGTVIEVTDSKFVTNPDGTILLVPAGTEGVIADYRYPEPDLADWVMVEIEMVDGRRYVPVHNSWLEEVTTTEPD